MNDRSRTTRRRVVAAAAGSTLALSLLAACGSGDDDVPVVNLYGFAAAAGFPEVIADCNERADGEYRIVGNLLPSDADGQRDVRRPGSHGIDRAAKRFGAAGAIVLHLGDRDIGQAQRHRRRNAGRADVHRVEADR